MTTTTKTKTAFKSKDHPIFKELGIEEAAKRTGYSPIYVYQVASGMKAAGRSFRSRFVAVFQRPEDALFLS